MSDIFDVLADGTRRELLRTLRERAGEVSVGELVEQLGISQPTVSKHLKVLRDHSLVAVREEGQHRYYRLDAEPLVEVEDWLAPFAAAATRPGSDGAGTIVEGGAFTAWAGAEVGDRVGRAAADTAHQARAALEAAQEKLQGAQRALAGRLPGRRRSL
ncbi:ArsR/SmtB family transcription factor [Pseudolysinimonas sp.]|uniref:ArsR/SmtB family transcription factor n=1 Tax=Pseudolysinimonas sp. TaxID=2680009 RepID=UPI003F7EF8B4